MKEEFGRHDAAELQQMSQNICRRILANDDVRNADVILAFWPMPTEPDIRPVVRHLYDEGKTVLLPRVISKTEMEFCPYRGDESLYAVPPYGILEPVGDAVETHGRSAVMLVPGVAFDTDCNRLGHGAGYYDRYMADTNIKTIGVCFPFQVLLSVPTDLHDIKVNEII